MTQRNFSNTVNKLYDRKCVITDSAYSLDAAHIIDKSICERSKQTYIKFHASNGILLRKDLHKIFDENKWCFNPFDIEKIEGDYIYLGIVYRETLPYALNIRRYFKIRKESYSLIVIRYNAYQKIHNIEQQISPIVKIDKNGLIYDYSNDTIMIDV